MNGKLSDLITSTNLLITMVILTLAAAGFGLYTALIDRQPWAYMLVGAVVALGLAGLGGAGVLIVQFLQSTMQRRRDETEASRFTANARENLAIMAGMQRVQNLQNTQLLRQARETQRMLPAAGDVLDVDALLIDDEVFAELDD